MDGPRHFFRPDPECSFRADGRIVVKGHLPSGPNFSATVARFNLKAENLKAKQRFMQLRFSETTVDIPDRAVLQLSEGLLLQEATGPLRFLDTDSPSTARARENPSAARGIWLTARRSHLDRNHRPGTAPT